MSVPNPEPADRIPPAARAELLRVVRAVRGGSLGRREALAGTDRLRPPPAASVEDDPLEDLLDAVDEALTRRRFAFLREDVEAGRPNLADDRLRRVELWLASGAAWPEEPPEGRPDRLFQLFWWALLAGTAASIATAAGLWLLGAEAVLERWKPALVGVGVAPVVALFLLHFAVEGLVVVGIVRRQFRDPPPPPGERTRPRDLWPFASAEALRAAERGEVAAETASEPPASALLHPRRRLEVINTHTGVAGVRAAGLDAGGSWVAWLGVGFLLLTVLSIGGLAAGAACPVLFWIVLAWWGLVVTLALLSFPLAWAVHGRWAFGLTKPVEPARVPAADPADAFLAALETLFPHAPAGLLLADLRDPRPRMSRVRVVEVLALAALLLGRRFDFSEPEARAFVERLRTPGLTLGDAADAFAERWGERLATAPAASGPAAATLQGVPVFDQR